MSPLFVAHRTYFYYFTFLVCGVVMGIKLELLLYLLTIVYAWHIGARPPVESLSAESLSTFTKACVCLCDAMIRRRGPQIIYA